MMMSSLRYTAWVWLFAVISRIVINCDASKSLNVQVSLRGKRYSIPDVSTVRELQNSVEEQSGLSLTKQGRVLFSGKTLRPSDALEDVGVVEGSVVNVVPKKKSSATKGIKSETKHTASLPVTSQSIESDSKSETAGGGNNMIEQLLKNSGIDPNQLEDIMKSMPGNENGEMPDMQESMSMVQNMMKSPLFTNMMNDPERLEQMRQMMLSNPMLSGMMSGMPGFEEILNDSEKWRETMFAAASMYKDLGSNLMQEGNEAVSTTSDAFGMSGSPSELDELSEGDE